jgi:hypothetical protein
MVGLSDFNAIKLSIGFVELPTTCNSFVNNVVVLLVPDTSNRDVGVVVPIPTFELLPINTLHAELDHDTNALLLAAMDVLEAHTIAVFESQ